MQTLRFADPETVTQYPLEIAAPMAWQPAPEGWCASVDLPDIPAHHAIAPSLSVVERLDLHFQFTLQAHDRAYPLHPVPDLREPPIAKAEKDKRIRTAIFQVLSHVVDFGVPLADAVARPRIHYDGERFQVEGGLPDESLDGLRKSFEVNVWEEKDLYFGGVHSVVPGGEPGPDPRRGGSGAVSDVTSTES